MPKTTACRISPKATSTTSKYGYFYPVADKTHSYIVDVENNRARIYSDSNDNGQIDEAPLTGWVSSGKGYQYYDSEGYITKGWQSIGGSYYYFNGESGFRTTGSKTINGTKCKFSSKGKLTSPCKPKTPSINSVKAYAGTNKLVVKWKKASYTTKYHVYRSESQDGEFTLIATLSYKARSYADTELEPGKTYYYKVRSSRNRAGITLWGSYSKIKGAIVK